MQATLTLPPKGYYTDRIGKCCYFFNEGGVFKFGIDYNLHFGRGSDMYRSVKKLIENKDLSIRAISDTRGERLWQKMKDNIQTLKQAS